MAAAPDDVKTRDWFAGQALVALIRLHEKVKSENGVPKETIATYAYEYADEMMRIRDLTQE